jgi:hypothetical protein
MEDVEFIKRYTPGFISKNMIKLATDSELKALIYLKNEEIKLYNQMLYFSKMRKSLERRIQNKKRLL